MAIAYVGGTTGGKVGTNGTPTTLTLTYSSTAGNTLALSIAAENPPSTVKDSNNTSWTQEGSASSYVLAWITGASAITSVTITIPSSSGNTNSVSAVLAEYSGVSGINNFASNNFGTSPYTVTTHSVTCSASYTTGTSFSGVAEAMYLTPSTGTTDVLVAAGGTGTSNTPTFTATNGNLRNVGPSEESMAVAIFSTAILMDSI
jgi:hypothetical protein